MIKFKPVWRLNQDNVMQDVFAPLLETARLDIRPPILTDYPSWIKVRARNKNYLQPYEPEWPNDALSHKFFIRRLLGQDKNRQSKSGTYFYLYLKSNNQIIGGLNLNNIQWGAARHATLGYWVDEAHQGQGYMREAVAEIITYSFDVLKLHRLNAACLPDNERSIKMLLALKFEEEGFAKNYLQINGRWQDHRLFGLCRPA